MRKLVLASFKHKTGDETFEQQRLIVIESSPIRRWDEDHHSAIEHFKYWFKENFEESELLSVVCYDTIDGTKPLPNDDDEDPNNPDVMLNFINWFGRQHTDFVQRWYKGEVKDRELLEKFLRQLNP